MTNPIVLAKGEGESLWFLGNLATIKAGSETTESWALVEMTAPAGYETPRHVHEEEDEVFYVLDGELRITIGDESHTAAAGAFVLSPKGVPHVLRVVRESRWLHLASKGLFVDLIRDIGKPAQSLTLPPAAQPDFELLRKRAAEHGITILGTENQ
jgi:quercetin dioxygenase-like cupin family protein